MQKKIFYHPEMLHSPDSDYSVAQSTYPLLVDKLHELYSPSFFDNKIYPLEREDLLTVHSKSYIDSVLNGNDSYPYSSLLRGGAVTTSILYSFENNTSSMVPAGGFHHASFNKKGTFCTFNSPMIGLRLLISHYGVKRIGYLDLDAHFSDGTHDIIQKCRLDNNFVTYDFANLGFAPGQPQSDYYDWLKHFEDHLLNLFSDCEFIYLYHGYDCFIDDPLGGYLSRENIKIRDDAVFSFLNKIKIPNSWCLGGGYFETNLLHEFQQYGIDKWINL